MNKEELPFQIFNNKKYTLYKNESYFSRGNKRLHRVVWEFYNGDIPENYEIHHKDENKHNNDINNLELIKKGEHQKLHGKKRFIQQPEFYKEFQKKGIISAAEWHKTEEGKEQLKAASKISWEKKVYHKLKCQVCNKEYLTFFPTRSKYCHNNCKAKSIRERKKSQISEYGNKC